MCKYYKEGAMIFVLQIIEDFQQKAIAKGSEDPQSVSILQKCEEFLPGQVKIT